MYCWRSKFGSQKEEIYDIIRNGFNDPTTYKVGNYFICIFELNNLFLIFLKLKGYEEAIPFTNNLYTSDLNRIENIRKNSNTKVNLAYRNGYILLCKVYTNRFVETNNEE